MKSFASYSLKETGQIARDWLSSIYKERENTEEATIVGLSGHLGSGKTAFVKAVAKILGVNEEVTSPTFVIMKIYGVAARFRIRQAHRKHLADWSRLVHIDAYRLERREELEVLEWEKLVSDKNNLIMIEWPENVGLHEFEIGCSIKFEIVDGAHRIAIK